MHLLLQLLLLLLLSLTPSPSVNEQHATGGIAQLP